MTREKVGQNSRRNRFSQHPQIQCARARDDLEGFVGIEESALDVKDIPKKRVVPTICHSAPGKVRGADGVVFRNEHAFVARDDYARRGCAASHMAGTSSTYPWGLHGDSRYR